MVSVKYDDLSSAFDFVSFASPSINNAYLCLDTGRIFCTSELNLVEDDTPDDLETSDRYLAIPHKNDLDLGKSLALRFVGQALPPHCYGQAEDFFRHKGAYVRFKQMLESQRALEQWYTFEADAVKKALEDWCAKNDIEAIG